MRSGWLGLAAACFVLMAPRAAAQAPVVVTVTVVDSARAPVAGADVSIVRSLKDVVASGATDARGRRTLRITERLASYEVVVRKLGYARASRFVPARGDSLDVLITLVPLTQRLDAVRVTADQDRSRERTHIDADAIAATNRPLFDAIDVIEKLRPNMTLEPPDITGNCVPAKNLFINGVLVAQSAPVNKVARRNVRGADIGASRARIGAALSSAPDDAILALNTIKPEHIEAIEYRNCTQVSVGRLHDESALFIVLKEGVQFKLGTGSYVVSAATQDSVMKSIMRTPRPQPSAQVITVSPPGYRNRILGVFDAVSGAPVDSVAITEVATGVTARTSVTGTVSLAFMQDGAGRLAFSKPGYRPDTLAIRIAPSDTMPITAVLIRLTP
ncbi:MAG: carboxypeptidase-like regulatory domain-containing protein [Gemmatimonadaceae bacterium]